MDGGYPQTLIENLLSEMKFTKGVLTPKTKQQGGKGNIAIRDTITTLSVYYKGSLNEKVESYTNPTITSINFHQSFPYKKEKSLKDMLVRAKKKRLTKGFTPV